MSALSTCHRIYITVECIIDIKLIHARDHFVQAKPHTSPQGCSSFSLESNNRQTENSAPTFHSLSFAYCKRMCVPVCNRERQRGGMH